MVLPVSFTVTKIARGWMVEGLITVAGVVEAETYRRGFRTKKEAEANAASWTETETKARTHVAEVAAARKAEAARLKEQRAARKAARSVQLNLFIWSETNASEQ